MATTYRETHSETTTTTVQSSSSSGVLDPQYYRGIPGLLKAIEVIASLIAYICVEVTLMCANATSTFGYFLFVTMFCFATTLILYIILLLKLQVRILRCDCAKARWPFFELAYYAVVLIFFFFGDLFMSMHGCLAGHKAGVFFGWVAFAAYVIDTVFIVIAFLKGRNSSTTTNTSSTPNTDPENRY